MNCAFGHGAKTPHEKHIELCWAEGSLAAELSSHSSSTVVKVESFFQCTWPGKPFTHPLLYLLASSGRSWLIVMLAFTWEEVRTQ